LETNKLYFQILVFFLAWSNLCHGQFQETVLGLGNDENTIIETSHSTLESNGGYNTVNKDGFLPNHNSASRFLTQATLGYNIEEIDLVTNMGFTDWIESEFQKPVAFPLIDKVIEYHNYKKSQTSDPEANSSIRFWDMAWWQYHMASNDLLRQRVAFALSELLVISKFSVFFNEPYAFASYYDIFLNNAFTNYRDILQEVTYHPAMGRYLTYLNNPKADTIANVFPDENYARELMQLFTIGLYELNNDGSIKMDGNSNPIPSYDNNDIIEFSKIFTGLTWGDESDWGRTNAWRDSSYVLDMVMWNDYHEPGVKHLLNNYSTTNATTVDGNADISEALDNLFSHPNTGPFVSRFLIQRLVTSNPSPEYINRVASAFNDNGSGTRGDMKAVIKAILLDPVAKDCASADDPTFGMLREPFVRYMQINKAFDNATISGNHRNDLRYPQEFLEQTPFTSPSVFNFFQSDYQPIGPVQENDLVAPEFQITNTKTFTGYINGLWRWIIEERPANEVSIYSNEPSEDYQDEIGILDFSDENLLADDEHLPILVDRLNLLLAHGKLSELTVQTIVDMVKELDAVDEEDLAYRARLAVYLVMSCPEYLITR